MMRYPLPNWAAKAFLVLVLVMVLLVNFSSAPVADNTPVNQPFDLNEIEREINAYVPDPQYEDDPFILITLQEAIMARREGNGGIGACLVCEATGEIVERGHNRQSAPYFRSDLHAEMDLLNRYEDRTRVTKSRGLNYENPRDKKRGLVLYTSVEPCPMCFTRIINSGVKKVYYAAPDEDGGMAHRFEGLPPSWKNMAQGMSIEPARCSPYLRILAQRLFRPMPQGPRGVR